MAFSPEHALEYLRLACVNGRMGHAYLFCGEDMPPLVELAARFLSLAQGMEPVSLEEVEARAAVRVLRPESKSRRISVEAIRTLEHDTRLKHTRWPLKAGLILGADRLGPQAENAFLKTLEEPPPDSLLLLLSTHPEQLLATTQSRCIKVPLFSMLPQVPEGSTRTLLYLLAAYFRGGHSGAGAALRLQKEFAALLEEEKGLATEKQKALFTEEKEKFGDATGNEWMERKEVEHDAAASAVYLKRREDLVKLLAAWFGDAARARAGGEVIECAAEADVVRSFGSRTRLSELLKRQHAVENLFSLLSTNVSEGLALETVFVEIFA